MQQMPARQLRPQGCGSQARWLFARSSQTKSMAELGGSVLVARASTSGLGACSQVHHCSVTGP